MVVCRLARKRRDASATDVPTATRAIEGRKEMVRATTVRTSWLTCSIAYARGSLDVTRLLFCQLARQRLLFRRLARWRAVFRIVAVYGDNHPLVTKASNNLTALAEKPAAVR